MKKTWVSYPLWLVYAIFTAVSAAAYFAWFSIYVWGIGQDQTAVWICLMFCAVAGIWFAGHGLSCSLGHRLVRQPGKKLADRRLAMVSEALLVLVLCTAAVLCRLHLLFHFDGEITGGIFYDMALVGADGNVSGAVHGISYLGTFYTAFLSFVLSFTGNKVAAGVMLQLVLQVAAIFVFYFAGRFLAGRGEALCALGIMAFAPGLCKGILSLTPEMFYFFLYALGLLLCGLYGKKTCCAKTPEGNGVHRKKGYVFAVLCGSYIGCISFADMTGWTLLVPAAVVCRKQQEAEWKAGKKGKNAAGVWGQWAVCILVSLAAAFLISAVYAFAAGDSYREILSVWLEVPVRQVSFSTEDIFRGIGAEPFSWMGLLVCLCGSLNIIGFWAGKTQTQDCWIFMLLFFLAFQIVRFEGLDYGIFLTGAEGILAGTGICSMGKRGRKSGLEEKYGAADGKARTAENHGVSDGKAQMEGKKHGMAERSALPEGEKHSVVNGKALSEEEKYGVTEDKVRTEERKHGPANKKVRGQEERHGLVDERAQVQKEEHGPADGKTCGQEERHGLAGERAQVQEEEHGPADEERCGQEEKHGLADGKARTEESWKDKPEVKLLDNPLPLPKKHVKRVMTYAKDVEGDELEFDFSVEENDDFDI